MAVSEKQKGYAKKWDKENLHTVSTRLRIRDFENYKAWCDLRGVTVTSEIKRFVMSELEKYCSVEYIYVAGGCLWGVQHFFRSLPGVVATEAGRANGTTDSLEGEYDGYAECVKVWFNNKETSVTQLVKHLFEIIDPYSIDKQGNDMGHKYRTGVYSDYPPHLEEAKAYLDSRDDHDRLKLEVLPLTNYIKSADEHQDRLERIPRDCALCHIPSDILNKYRK